jgi:hypothetical protein
VKHRQGSRNIYSMYMTTTITPQWQHMDDSTRHSTGTDHHCLGTCPNMYKFRYTLRKEGHGLLDEPLFHCLMNRLIGIEPPALQGLLQWPKRVAITRRDWVYEGGWSRTPHTKRRRVSHVMWAACGRALLWSISTPRASFPVIQGQLLALLPHMSVYVSLEQSL